MRRQIRWIDGLGCLALGEASIAQRDKIGLQLFLLVRIRGLYWSRLWDIQRHQAAATAVLVVTELSWFAAGPRRDIFSEETGRAISFRGSG